MGITVKEQTRQVMQNLMDVIAEFGNLVVEK